MHRTVAFSSFLLDSHQKHAIYAIILIIVLNMDLPNVAPSIVLCLHQKLTFILNSFSVAFSPFVAYFVEFCACNKCYFRTELIQLPYKYLLITKLLTRKLTLIFFI